MSSIPETTDRSTQEQRNRHLISMLDEKLEYIRVELTDDLRINEDKTNKGMRNRTVEWRLGQWLFLVTYHEVKSTPGMAQVRIRTQPYLPGETSDLWKDIATLGQFDDALRMARKSKALTTGDLKAIKHSTKHEGDTPEGLILVGISGSHAYGLNHNGFVDVEGKEVAPSDRDTRGVFVVPTKDVLSLGRHKELVEQKTTDTKFDEVERFIALCLKCNPERLEMLAAVKDLTTPEGELLVQNQGIFLWHHDLEVQFVKAADETKLPEKPDFEKANEILLQIRRNHLEW